MRILVVDDEAPARERLKALVQELDAGEVVGEAANGAEALAGVDRLRPDVLLLDIRMPGMDGLEVARHLARLDSSPAVIFTTAYEAHALEAFSVHAVDYLLKPVRRERLGEALGRARRLSRAQLDALGVAASGVRTHVSASTHGGLRVVPVEQVRYFLADQKYVTAGYPGGELLLEDSLKSLESELGEQFVRVHRNALVAARHVQAVERDERGHCVVRLDGVGFMPAVSRRLLASVRRRLR